jgi:uncharacterized protein YbbC (DUF1343 family)
MGIGSTSQSCILLAVASALLACGGAAERKDEQVLALPGIDVLLGDSLHLARGLRVGLITNHTGIDAQGVSSIDRLASAPELDLVALFSPEHGIRGTVRGGEGIDSDRDEATGLPIHSLYGSTRKPTPEMLEGIDVLLFDIQDIGARYYTYVSTMAYGMEAAGEAGIPFVVLDRPNPVDGVTVQGNILDPDFATFVGMFPIPMRHGMTPGELAHMYREEFGIRVELHVVPVRGWQRAQRFADTGLPWLPPSPNMPSEESALHYAGTCLFEGTNISVGRGTPLPFQQIGAPWLDGDALAARLNAYGLAGVRFEPVTFTPEEVPGRRFAGIEVYGVRLVAVGDEYDPTHAAVAALIEARSMSGDRWEWREAHFDRLAGTDLLRRGIEEGQGLGSLVRGWRDDLRAFEPTRARYLIYH